MQDRMHINIEECGNGFVVKEVPYDNNNLNSKVFRSRKELADYINPQTEAVTENANNAVNGRKKNSMSMADFVASRRQVNEERHQNIDLLHNLGQMNINAANQMCGGQQYSMSNLNANQMPGGSQFNPLTYQDAINTAAQQCHCNTDAAWRRGVNRARENIEKCLAEQDRIQKEHDAEHNQAPIITPEVQALIDAAVYAGYHGNIARFLDDVKALKAAANLQDDGK